MVGDSSIRWASVGNGGVSECWIPRAHQNFLMRIAGRGVNRGAYFLSVQTKLIILERLLNDIDPVLWLY